MSYKICQELIDASQGHSSVYKHVDEEMTLKTNQKKLENILWQAIKNGIPLSISKNLKLQMIDSRGGGVSYQTHIVTTKLPNGKYPNCQIKISKPTNYK